MPKFDVTVTRVLRLEGTFTVSAKDEDAASEKAAQAMHDWTLTWQVEPEGTKPLDVDWQEVEDDLEDTRVEEA